MYTVFHVDGRDAAACYTLHDLEKGIPPHWNLYIAVANADESAKRAGELGGTVLAPPMDVMDAGRMAVIQDPTGAKFCIWQAKGTPGITIAGVNGSLCWADLNTPHPDVAKTFYEGLFGWKFNAAENDRSGYLHIQNGEEFLGGVPPASSGKDEPAQWLIYLLTGDVEVSAAKAKELGGNLVMPAMKIEGIGEMAVVADPAGATFALFSAPQSIPQVAAPSAPQGNA
jgi:hypothetical protein